MMADAIKAAGLPDRCVPHGLRKAAARRLAEAGCSEKQIAAVTGHTTLKEVARYTRAANQERLAADAVDMLSNKRRSKIPKP
jgi:integrase